jgi:hypothetical protein
LRNLIEHELGRRIATMLRRELNEWKRKMKETSPEINKHDTTTMEPVARFLKSYAVFIDDHGKEDKFFDLVDERNLILDKENEILVSNIQILNILIFAQEDDKIGFGVQERERAGLHAGNDSRILNNDYTRLILIVTVVVIIGVSSYALYKIYLIRRKSNQSKLKK